MPALSNRQCSSWPNPSPGSWVFLLNCATSGAGASPWPERSEAVCVGGGGSHTSGEAGLRGWATLRTPSLVQALSLGELCPEQFVRKWPPSRRGGISFPGGAWDVLLVIVFRFSQIPSSCAAIPLSAPPHVSHVRDGSLGDKWRTCLHAGHS